VGVRPISHHALTTGLTTPLTTAGLPDASTYTTIELISCLVTLPARAYGSEGWQFGSVWARPHVGISRVPRSRLDPPACERICERNAMQWPRREECNVTPSTGGSS
jgi:hypothetical protein